MELAHGHFTPFGCSAPLPGCAMNLLNSPSSILLLFFLGGASAWKHLSVLVVFWAWKKSDLRPNLNQLMGKFGKALRILSQAGKLARSRLILAKISTMFSRNSSVSAELWDFYRVVPEKVWAAVITTSSMWSFCKTLLDGVSPCGVNRGRALARKRGGQLKSGFLKW